MATKRQIDRLIAWTQADIGAADLDQIAEAFGITREELYKTLAPLDVLYRVADNESELPPLANLHVFQHKDGWFFRYGPANDFETVGPYEGYDAAIKAARDE